ncbi:expressed unknown protein [Seminavis robusta]|uniref:Uncharacterized protein n=1 Tax=Seminavis robusta TaxID=568900 RepID=A0A9N8ESW2_9STRA|nr:expressed unknown protein [Seminavis robusta]|eukprot:Sro1603_g285291.1  (196) ;mRNA; f:9484-10071
MSHLSTPTFSHPSVRVVDLTLELNGRRSWDPLRPTRIFERLICDLEALERLKLAHKDTRPFQWQFPRFYGCFVIKSNSLKFLDVVGLAGGMWIQCQCPRLEIFRCKGGGIKEGNGSLPNLNRQQFDSTKAKFSQIESVTANLKLLEVPFVGLTIPRSCECTVISFSNRISAATSYDFDYRRHIDFLQNYDLQDEN